MNDVQQRVRGVVAGKFGLDGSALRDDLHFERDLQADSLDAVHLVLLIEDEFGIDIPDENLADLATLHQVVSLVSTLLDDPPPARRQVDCRVQPRPH